MSIGTSIGAFHEDDFAHVASPWMDSLDNNEIGPDESIAPNPAKVLKVADKYDTPLNQEEQAAYSKKFSPEDSRDYDMQGYYKANPNADHKEGDHFPDTFKKPNHPTFSDESIYHGQDGNAGGHWNVLNGEDIFTPGATNVQTHGLLGLMDYFDKVEPDVRLMLPKK